MRMVEDKESSVWSHTRKQIEIKIPTYGIKSCLIPTRQWIPQWYLKYVI